MGPLWPRNSFAASLAVTVRWAYRCNNSVSTPSAQRHRLSRQPPPFHTTWASSTTNRPVRMGKPPSISLTMSRTAYQEAASRLPWSRICRHPNARPHRPRAMTTADVTTPAGNQPMLSLVQSVVNGDQLSLYCTVLPLNHETIRAKSFTSCRRHFVTSALIFCFHVSG